MNPDTRTLLKVEVGDAAEADEIFSTLMGEKCRATARLHPSRGPQGPQPRIENRLAREATDTDAITTRRRYSPGGPEDGAQPRGVVRAARGQRRWRAPRGGQHVRDSYAVSHAYALAIAANCLRRSDDDEWSADFDDAEGARPLVVMDESRITIGTSESVVAEDGRRYAFADHHCFACGASNPIGMRLPHRDRGGSRAHLMGRRRRLCRLERQDPWRDHRHDGRRGDGMGSLELDSWP